METQHPETESLAHYLESPESGQHGNIRRHLLSCQHCRNRIDELSNLEIHIKKFAASFPQIKLNNIEDTSLEQFVDGQTPEDFNQKARQQIQSDPQALKRALHFATHSAAMSKSYKPGRTSTLENTKASLSKYGKKSSLLSRILRLFELPTPAWVMAPASIALAAALTLVMVNGFDVSSQQNSIVAFQDDPSIRFSKAGIPGSSIGFFHDAQSQNSLFSGMSISVEKSALHFQWQKLENVHSYNLTIYKIDPDEKTELAKQETSKPVAMFEKSLLSHQQHYQWILKGNTTNGLTFETQGDFIYIGKE